MSRCTLRRTLSRCTILASMLVLLFGSLPVALADDLPRDAKDAITAHDEDAAAIRAEAEKKLEKRKAELIAKLRQIESDFTKAGKVEDAAAVRDLIRRMTDTYPAGTFVDVEWKGTWYEAQVLESKDGKWHIRYDGYGPEWDEWVDTKRIRSRDKAVPGVPAPGASE